jgi:hypothetical protein
MRSTIEGPRSCKEFSATDLDQLERQVNAWRRKQRTRVRLPSELWDSAGWLARSLGVSQVSRRLRLDYYRLSRGLGQAKDGPDGPPDWPPPAFVELALGDPGSLGAGGEFRAELGQPAGSQLTLHLGRDVRAVVALAEAFWRQGQ